MTRAALVSMPFGPITSPSIALGLLQSVSQNAGHETRCFHFNVEFAKKLGVKEYSGLCEGNPSTISMAGEWVFSTNAMTPGDFLSMADPSLHPDAIAAIEPVMVMARALVPEFLDHAAQTIATYEPLVVGFTSVFQQTCASLAAVRAIKKKLPNALAVIGGANVEEPMGKTLLTLRPELDGIVSGEGENAWLDVLEYAADGTLPGRPSGLLLRGHKLEQASRSSIDLDQLPDPNYDDYFNSALPDEICDHIRLPFESSRGCWWGAKSHCIFCGLNGSALTFRKKGPARAEAELRRLVDRYKIEAVSAVDNIIPHEYFNTLLPALAAKPLGKPLFYETKANLDTEKVNTLAAAGIDRIQPGIESLSDDVLKLMRKGITGCQNISLLRDCRDKGVGVEWNYLWGFPGEEPASYEYIIGLIPTLHHLEPPSGWGRLRIDRYSPLHTEPEVHGLANLRAIPSYQLLFPGLSDHDADQLAYYFNADLLKASIDDELANRLRAALKIWQQTHATAALVYAQAEENVLVWDLRDNSTEGNYTTLTGSIAHAFMLLFDPMTPALLAEVLEVPLAHAQLLVAELVNKRLVVRNGKTCVNVCNEFGQVKLPEPAAKRLHRLISKVVAEGWEARNHSINPRLDLTQFGLEVDFLLEIGAAASPHGGRSLFDHLVGVANRLQKLGGKRETVIAGLFHSVYGTNRVAALLDNNKSRERLIEVIGSEQERTVFQFSKRGPGMKNANGDEASDLHLIYNANSEDIRAFLGQSCAQS